MESRLRSLTRSVHGTAFANASGSGRCGRIRSAAARFFSWFFVLGREVVSEPLRKMVVNRRGAMRLMQRVAASVSWLMEGLHRANVLGWEDESA